jgi:hypothetical protein
MLQFLKRPLVNRLHFSILDLMEQGNVFGCTSTITPDTMSDRSRVLGQTTGVFGDLSGKTILIYI